MSLGSKAASSVLRAAWRPATQAATRLAETVDKEIVADVFSCAMKKQTGVSLKYMLTFGHVPLERQVSICGRSFCEEEERHKPTGETARREISPRRLCRGFPSSPPSSSLTLNSSTLPTPTPNQNTNPAPPVGPVPPQRAPCPPRPPRRRARKPPLRPQREGARP